MSIFYVTRQNPRSNLPPEVKVLLAGRNLITGETDFKKSFGTLTSIEADLLLISSAIFAADRATPRGEREELCRSIQLSIPVVNIARLIPLIPLLEEILYTLSNDGWQISLRQEQGTPFEPTNKPLTSAKTLLFSGGLDSLAAAIEFGQSPDTPLLLASHKTHNNVTNSAQRELVTMLREAGLALDHQQFFVSSRSSPPNIVHHDIENSQRTRSFLFLILGGLSADRRSSSEIIFLAENGQLAIHLPLTQGRIGALSTHTAHPQVLALMEELLSKILGRPISIVNPYVHKTKKEVISTIHSYLPKALTVANSCWMNARLPQGFTHCGACIPCFIRRIAIEDITTDQTAYARDPWREPLSRGAVDDDAKRNMADLAEFIKRFEIGSDEEIMSEWPELYSDILNSESIISMYRRFANEGRRVLSRYPNLEPFLN